MAILRKAKDFVASRFKSLTSFQRCNHTLDEGGLQYQFRSKMDSGSVAQLSHIVDTSKWKKVDAKVYGITRSLIPSSLWTVLTILRGGGFETYLVGGCVRDLLLHRVPKDFDVITTANLKQIRIKFHRCQIVGQRFPICKVHIKGSVFEVSSFETVARHAEEKEKVFVSQMPSGCDEKDFILWRNSMHRDFTINSLFFDPFLNQIYDYTNGMADLRSFKLQTVIPAQLSFQEDCARILRGLRIAGRLGLSFSKDTETAICRLTSSIMRLDKPRLMMELNYMLSYGAAEPSICLLQRFNLLELFLPFHAAYIDQHAGEKPGQNSLMLRKLFFNLDKMVRCDQPCDCSLWVGLLAFHQALVNNPQDAFVIWAFASILYHGKWKNGVKFARENATVQVKFVPEISGFSEFKSDEDLAEEVTQLASLVQVSVGALIDTDSLFKSMSRYPHSPCSGLVFVPKQTGNDVSQLLDVLVNDIESFKNGRESFTIDHHLLGKGNPQETRFVLGKVILQTLSGGLVDEGMKVVKKGREFSEEIQDSMLSDPVKHQILVKKDMKRSRLPLDRKLTQEMTKKQRLVKYFTKPDLVIEKEKVLKDESQLMAKKHQKKVETSQLAEKNNLEKKKDRHLLTHETVKMKSEKLKLELVPIQASFEDTSSADMKRIIPTNESQKGKSKTKESFPEPSMGHKHKKDKAAKEMGHRKHIIVENEKCQDERKKHAKTVEKEKGNSRTKVSIPETHLSPPRLKSKGHKHKKDKSAKEEGDTKHVIVENEKCQGRARKHATTAEKNKGKGKTNESPENQSSQLSSSRMNSIGQKHKKDKAPNDMGDKGHVIDENDKRQYEPRKHRKTAEKEKNLMLPDKGTKQQIGEFSKCNLSRDEINKLGKKKDSNLLLQAVVKTRSEKHKEALVKETKDFPSLSCLFRR